VSRRASAYVVAVLSAVALGGWLALPAFATTGTSGGGGVNGSSSIPSSSNQGSQASVQPGNGVVSASGGGMTVQTHASTFLRDQLTFTGSAPASDAGATVEIQRLGHETGWKWADTAHSTIRRGGSFAVTWRTNHIGQFSIHAVVTGTQSTRAAAASPSLTVIVYRPSVATLYGPGFWGHRTACGQVLRKTTIGLANRTLPCGTPVAVFYHGRMAVVPVIDRGPYTSGVDWDLTEATAKALGIGGTATIGAVSLPTY
jgi:rare lipoprotein A